MARAGPSSGASYGTRQAQHGMPCKLQSGTHMVEAMLVTETRSRSVAKGIKGTALRRGQQWSRLPVCPSRLTLRANVPAARVNRCAAKAKMSL